MSSRLQLGPPLELTRFIHKLTSINLFNPLTAAPSGLLRPLLQTFVTLEGNNNGLAGYYNRLTAWGLLILNNHPERQLTYTPPMDT